MQTFRRLLGCACVLALAACASAPLESEAVPDAAPPVAAVPDAAPAATETPAPVAKEEVVAPRVLVPEERPAVKPPASTEASTAPPPVPPRSAPLKISATLRPGYYVNVGAFAQAPNAENAYRKLQDAGMPAVAQSLTLRKATLTRVSAGPFAKRADAKAAAAKIAKLPLEAVVVKH